MTCSISLCGIYPPASCIDETFVRLDCEYVSPDGRMKKMASQSFTLACAMRFFQDVHKPEVAHALQKGVQEMTCWDFQRLRIPVSIDFPSFFLSNFLPKNRLFHRPLIVFHGEQFENFSLEAHINRKSASPQ